MPQIQQTLDTNITVQYGGFNGMVPKIINGSGCEVSINYLRKHYETAVKINGNLLQLSTQLQDQRDATLAALDGADSIIEEQAAQIEELQAALDAIEAARLRELDDYDRTVNDASIYRQ